MFHVKNITAAASTTEANPATAFITPSPGIIHQVNVIIPEGHAGLTKTRIYWLEHQIYPTDRGDYFSGDGTSIQFPDFFPTIGLDDELKITVVNDDTEFSHDVIVQIGILPEAVLLPTKAFSDISEKLSIILRRIGVIQ